MKQEDFCGAIAPTYFVGGYLTNEDISRVLVIFFPKINQFTCDNIFMTFAQMGQAFIQAVLKCLFWNKKRVFEVVKLRGGLKVLNFRHEYMAVL